MPEQRVQTIKIVWQGDNAKRKVVEMTRALSDADKSVEALSKAFGENATVTATVNRTQRELAAEARRVVREQERQTAELKRQQASAESYVDTLRHQVRMQSLTVDQQEQYNAQLRLGKAATASQRDEVAKLVTQLQQQRVASGRATGSMRNMRGVAQNLGWQLQDMAVQLQMGTSAFVVLSQQGSQFAAAFGPTGAIVGAMIAVGGALAGALIPQLLAAEEGVKDLRKELSDLTEQELMTLEGDLKALAVRDIEKAIVAKQKEIQSTKDLIVAEEEQFKKSQANAKKNLKSNDDRLRAISQAVIAGGDKTYQDNLLEQTALIQKQQDELEGLIQRRRRLTEGADFVSSDILGLSGITAEEIEAENKVIAREKQQIEQRNAQRKRAVEAQNLQLTKQTETINEEYKRRVTIIDNYVETVGKKDQFATEAFAVLEQWKTHKLKEESDKRQKEAEREADKIIKENARRDKSLAGIGRTVAGQDPVEQEQAKHNQTMAKLESERIKLKNKHHQDHKRINALAEAEDQRYTLALQEAEAARVQITLASVNTMESAVSNTVDLLTNGVEQIRQQTEEMTNTQKVMFFFMQSVSAAQALINGITMGTELAKSAALYDWTGVTSQAWIAAGTAIGAAQAGAIMGTTIAGTFDNGGYIPTGQVGITSEYGDELVNGVLVKGPASVTSREQTSRIMNREDRQGSGNMVNNQTFSINALGDKQIEQIVRRAAKQGAQDGYNMVKSDFVNGRGIRSDLKRSTGI